jgi:signal peptidase I
MHDTLANTATLDPELDARLKRVREDEEKKRRFREQVKRERRFLIPILVFVLLLFPNFGRAKVLGSSMEPLFKEGDALVVLKTFRYFAPIKEGDIVVVRKQEGEYAGEDIVKRVAFIQNATGDAPFPRYVETSRGKIEFRRLFPWVALGGMKVPPKHILVIGDNLRVSVDSRDPEIGAVAESEVVSKILMR